MKTSLTCTVGLLLVLGNALGAQTKPPGMPSLLVGEAPPIEKVSRVAARIATLEDALASMLSTRASQPGPGRDVQDAKIGLRVVALRWYEAGQKADLPLKAQLILRADLIFNHLSACDGLLDSLLVPPTVGAQAMPGEKEAKEQAQQKKLVVLAKLADLFNKQMPENVSGDSVIGLGNTLAGLLGSLASTTGTFDVATLVKLQPGRQPVGPTLEEQQARLGGVNPSDLLAAVQASAIANDLKKQFTEIINIIKDSMTDPQAADTAVGYLEMLQDNLQLADSAGRSMWLPPTTRQTLFTELQKGLALVKYPPTRTNGLTRLSKAKDLARLVHAVGLLPLTEEQKVDIGKLLDQTVSQLSDLGTRDQGQDALDTMNNFAQLAVKVHSGLADTTIPKPLDQPYQTLLKRFESERSSAITQFKLQAPAAAKPHIEAMNACAGDLELLKTLPSLLDQIKPFAGKQYSTLENGVREAATTIASKPDAEHGPAVNRIREFQEAQSLVNEYATVRMPDDLANQPVVRDLSCGQYFTVVKAAEANLSELFKALASVSGEKPDPAKPPKPGSTPTAAALDWNAARKKQKDLNRQLGDLQLAVTAQAYADDMVAVGNWSDIEFDPAVDSMTKRFCEAVKSSYDMVGKPAVLQLDTRSGKILEGYRPWMKMQSELIRNYAPRLRNIPRDLRGFLSQLYRPGAEPGQAPNARDALGNAHMAVLCLTVNEAAYCDQLGYLEHVGAHLKSLTDNSPRNQRQRPPRGEGKNPKQ